MSKTSDFSRRQFAASALATAALAALPATSRADAKMQQQIYGDEIMNLTPYILFDGDCHQAMEFYNSCFGGALTSMKVKKYAAAKDYMPAVQQEKSINARLKSGNVEISASDWLRGSTADSHSRQHGLPLRERRRVTGVEGSFRKTL